MAADKIIVLALQTKQPDIMEAAKFSVEKTYDNNLRYFPVSAVNDSAMRKRMESLGSDVFVKYQKENDPIAIPDSTVVFSSHHDLGNIQIIFDFATEERDLISLIQKERKSYLTKVGDRTYYRRSDQYRDN